MNKANLKAYAPQARRDFIAAVTARANLLGVSAKAIAPSVQRGDIAIIEGREWPAKVAAQRDKLIARSKKDGFEQTIESVAYTWFNRFAALRYMELHDYLDHGWRVLSSRDGGLPEILRHAADAKLSGLDQVKARDMQLAGNQDNELYKMLLVAQCNELSRTMPFLFEHIDDETELLLPENLLRTDSIVAKLVAAVPDEDWAQVEVIGWLYQFYISEKKDEVIGKMVKSEDIPAATQLFTPNWIVQYLVQNSVGRLWLMANPGSTLKSQWPYYIEPAEQTSDVQAQLNDLLQTRMAEDGGSLNPESITVLDPACGSGHILVEAYELLKAIYLERGYRLRDIPKLILEKNLYGIDIDDRAAQLAGFALMMKARADDRRLFDDTIKLNVMALQESAGIDDDALANTVFDAAIAIEGGDALPSDQLFGGGQLRPQHSSGLNSRDLRELIQFFVHAKTFGSLLAVPDFLAANLGKLASLLRQVEDKGDLLAKSYAHQIREHYLLPAQALATHYDVVVANPPYMGLQGMNALLAKFVVNNYPAGKADLMTAVLLRGLDFSKKGGLVAFVTHDSWMFLSTFSEFRSCVLNNSNIDSLVHVGWNCFPEVHTYNRGVSFVLHKARIEKIGSFYDLSRVPATVDKDILFTSQRKKAGAVFLRHGSAFRKIPSEIIAYWISERWLEIFDSSPKLADYSSPRQGLATADNNRFLRLWTEPSQARIAFACKSRDEASTSGARWFPYNKGGAYRKWYGNHEWVVNWENDGEEIRKFGTENGGKPRSRAQNTQYYFCESLSWSKVTNGGFSLRYYEHGFIFDVAGCSIFVDEQASLPVVLGVLNSSLMTQDYKRFFPTINLEVGQIAEFPIPKKLLSNGAENSGLVRKLINISKSDWDSQELSWNFRVHPLLEYVTDPLTKVKLPIHKAYEKMRDAWQETVKQFCDLESRNNTFFIDQYGIDRESSFNVDTKNVTLLCNPHYRYGTDKPLEEIESRLRFDTVRELVSYIIGCVMGRYSLDEPGLIYAHAGNRGFEAARYASFAADLDAVVPVTDENWFYDDATNRVREFLLAVWGGEALDKNMVWLAENLGRKSDETPEEAIRRYLSTSFYKGHLQAYKKRPIYWLFSSGKHGAFQSLVYLHRYHEGTLSRMRAEYVVPLTAKIAARIDLLTKDADLSSSATARAKIQKQIEILRKKQAELLSYDEKLRHYADMRIQLDLDDGVKVNYGKFGDLLAEVKAVTGGTSDD
jgi:type II restriction/modification system DNA methylase subunit YeeA